MTAAAAKPTEALKRLREVVATSGREGWNKLARVSAVLGNCPKSRASMLSGTRPPCLGGGSDFLACLDRSETLAAVLRNCQGFGRDTFPC